MAVSIVQHPIAQHYLTSLRDKETSSCEFQRYSDLLTPILLIEATRDLPLRERAVETPLGPHAGSSLAQDIVVVPILRAGISMLHTAIDILPRLGVGYVGVERDEATAKPRTYYHKLPDLTNKVVLVIDPMLATGGSASCALDFVKQHGVSDVRFVCVVAAPEGVEYLTDQHPEVSIYTAAVDERLNEAKFIVPGLGDYGDRYHAT